MRKVWNFCVLMASYPRLSPNPIVNPYVRIEETRKHGVVEKGLVCQSPRKQRAASLFPTLKALFFLHNTNILPWTVVLFVNHYLSHICDHRAMLECLNIGRLAVILLGSDGYMV